jgi:hypothetical protein
MAIMVGDENATLGLVDQNGNAVTGATWTVDNGSVLSLSNDDPPLLGGLTSGTATVTASIAGISAHATVTVYPYGPGHRFPAGTALWSVSPPAGSSATQLLQMAPGGGGADFVGIETGAVLRGLSADGRQLWQSAGQSTSSSFLPDATGGVFDFGANLVHHDGATGIADWQYTPTMAGASQSGLIANTSAVAADNTALAVQTDYVSGSSFRAELLGINAGSVAFQYALPLIHYELHSDVDFCNDVTIYDQPGPAGPIAVAPDGSVYMALTHGSVTGGFDCHGNYAINDDLMLTLLKVDAGGNTSTRTIHAYAGPGAEAIYPREVIPDGNGGVLAAWDHLQFDASGNVSASAAMATHVDASGGSTDFILPLTTWCGEGGRADPRQNPSCFFPSWTSTFAAKSMVLSDGNTVAATNGDKLALFDAASGVASGLWTAPMQHNLDLIAALWGSGAAVTDVDNSTSPPTQRAAHFFATTGPMYDGWTSTGYVPNLRWPTMGVWAGISPNGAYTQVSQTEIVAAESPWAFPGGNPSGSRGPSLIVEDIPAWGKNLTTATAVNPAGCELPIVDNGRTLPAAEPVDDASIPENVKLDDKLTKAKNTLLDPKRLWITSPSCQNFFSKLKDPNASNYLAGWSNAVEQQNWFNGHLSTITLFNAGAYETGIPADKLAQMKVFPVSCIELTPPTLLQIENGDKSRYLVGLAQLQPPSNEAYYNGAALDYIIPSAIAHEAFHNVTQKNDINVRTILGMSPADTSDPNNPNYSTDDISLKMENEGCAPPR